MRVFIKLTISFLLLLSIIIIVFVELSEHVVSEKSDFKLKTKPKYIVLGHSHPECAFNDSLIDGFLNLSQSGESYYYTYFKTTKIIEQNPSIEVVFVEFTNNQINESMNNWIWDGKYIGHRYINYSPFMDISDKVILAKNNLTGYFNWTSLSLKSNLDRILKQNFAYSESIGGYLYLERDKTDSLVNAIDNNYSQLKTKGISEFNLQYLTRIINFCEEQDKRVILIRSPQHKKYPGYSNELMYQGIRKNRYSSIEYLDFSKFPLTNSEFGDLDHLNTRGAKVFSSWFSKALKNGILLKSDKQSFIDNEIKARMHNRVDGL